MLGFGSRFEALGRDSLPFDKKIEVIASITLADDRCTGAVTLLFNSISNLAPLIMVHCLQNRYRLQEVFILVTLVLRGILHDVIERVPVELPKRASGFGDDCCSSWGVI